MTKQNGSYLLDTSVIIDYLKGNPTATTMIDSLEGEFYGSFICLAELYEGLERMTSRTKIEPVIKDHFASYHHVFGLDEKICQNFAQVRVDLKKRGEIIEDMDIFIAATCLAHNLTLVTKNPKHFSRVKNLETLPL
ncbi:MAG: putative ribonuclease VapC [Microgenomates group bacterium GW2011_GWA1_48_10]|nr:MAG: putative ribonuclease VapC [Microgenomates group bacterium GW2011_GWA1_48_10]